MREYIKTCKLPNDHNLQTDLTALQYHYKAGEMLIESKDDAKRRGVKSPDLADSLALTFAEPPVFQRKAAANHYHGDWMR
jgi:hypothetical protein